MFSRRAGEDGEQGEDATGGGPPALVEVEHRRDVGQRPQQALGHEDQHRVEADLEVAAQRRPAAEEQGAGEAGEDRHAHERDERRGGADRVGVGVAVGRRRALDALALAVLGGERLDGGDAAEVGAERAGQVGHRAADPVVERLEAPLEDQGPDDDQRDRQEGQDQQLHRGEGEDRPDQDHVERGLQDRREADVEEALELVDVVVEGGQRGALGPRLVPAQVEVLDVVVGLHAQVVLHPLGKTAPQHGGDVLARGLDDPDDGVDPGQPRQLGVARVDAEQVGDDRVVAAHHDVDRRTDEQLGGHVGDLVEHRHDHRPGEAGAVAAVAVPQRAQRCGRCGGCCGCCGSSWGGHGSPRALTDDE